MQASYLLVRLDDLDPAAGAAAGAAGLADVSDAVRELGLEADVAGGGEVDVRLLALPEDDGGLQDRERLLLLPATHTTHITQKNDRNIFKKQ